MPIKRKLKEATVEPKTDNTEEVQAPVEEKTEEKMVHMTPEEKEALEAQEKEEKEKGASTIKLEKATAVVSKMFNLSEDYKVTSFSDKGKGVKLTTENSEFKLDIEIKNAERHGLIFED